MRYATWNAAQRAERRAAIGQGPMAFGRHGQFAGTVHVRPQLAKPARARRGTRRAFVPSMSAQAGMEPRHSPPCGGRPMYSSGGGLS